MVGALVDGTPDVNHRIAGEDALAQDLLDALVDGRDETTRDVTTHDLVHELIAVAGIGLDAKPAVAVLTGTARLLLVAPLCRGDAPDGLAIGDAQRDGMRRDAHAILEAIEKHGDLRLTDGRDDRLTGILVALDLEGGIRVGGLLEECVQLALGAPGVGLDGNAIERVGEAEGGRLDLTGDGEGVPCHGLELGHDDDVASCRRRDLVSVTSGHEVDVAEALGLARARIDELDAGGDGTGQNLEEGEAAVLWVVERLEVKGNGAVVIRGDVKLLAVDKRDATKVGHRGEPGHGGVHERDDALLTHAGTCEDGHEDTRGKRLAEKTLELVLGDDLALEIPHHELVVGLHDQLGELRARLVGGVCVRGGDVLDDDLAILEMASLHVHDVNDAGEVITYTHGNGDGREVVAEALPQHRHGRLDVSVRTIDTVDEDRACHGKVLGGVPQAGGDRAHAS